MDKELNTKMNDDMGEGDLTCSTGTTNLLIGGGVGAYGTTIALTAGYVCPICVIATPLFLGWGGVQKYKYLKNKQKTATPKL